MAYTGKRHGLVLACGLGASAAAAVSPAGVFGGAPPLWSWGVWIVTLCAAIWMFRQAGLLVAEAGRRVSWLVPVVAIFALPAALMVPSSSRWLVGAALMSRALSAAALAAGMATWLGPSGLVCGARQLGLPARLTDVLEATLASLATVLRQVRAMLRAREARRTSFGAWSDLIVRPLDTVRGFGRLVAALLLRSLERAEALERARRARGIEP
jgi:energy-coupling factor transporter transmembrane protein EcfT